jgi:hypothetical protein
MIGIETRARGAESRTTVNEPVVPYSVVERPVGTTVETVPVAVLPGGFAMSDVELFVVPATLVHERVKL